jgi:hypothetical protein
LRKVKDVVDKISTIMGGFIIILGIILLGIFSLIYLNMFNPIFLLDETLQIIFIWILLILGLVDLISGIILFLSGL